MVMVIDQDQEMKIEDKISNYIEWYLLYVHLNLFIHRHTYKYKYKIVGS